MTVSGEIHNTPSEAQDALGTRAQPLEAVGTDAEDSDVSTVRFRREWPALVAIVLFAVVMMWPFTLGGKALMPDTWRSIHPWARGVDVLENRANVYDPVIEYGPWFEYAQTCLKEGRVPHWNPGQFCGAPLYANRLVPFFYPPFILAALVSSPHKLLGWFQLINLALSGWGMYFLLRRWRMSPSVGWAGSCLYLTCGVHFLPFPLWTLGTIGFPWLLWALEGFLERPGLRPIAVSGFIAGLIMMVGYPVCVVHLTYFVVLYFVFVYAGKMPPVLPARCRRYGVSERGRGHWTILPLVLVAVYFLGLGVAAIANVPAWAYAQHTVRQIEGFSDRAFEREKRRLITPEEEAGLDPIAARFGEGADVLLPVNGRGTQRAWQYGGVLLYFLAFLGILAGRPRARLLGILGLLFALIVWIPEVYLILIDILPGWGVTILLPIEVVNLIACLLAAFGIEALVANIRAPNLFWKIVFSVLAVAAIALTWRFLHEAPVVDLPILLVVPDRNLLAYSPFHVFYLAAIAALSVLIAAVLFLSRPVRWLRWGLVGAVLIFSLATHWYLQPVYSPADYTPPTPFTRWLSRTVADSPTGSVGRLARWAELSLPFNPHKRAKSPFIPNLHLNFGITDVGGYDSLVPRRYIDYCTLFEDSFIDYRALIAFEAPSTMYHPRFRALGVRWILSQGELPDESRRGCTLVWDDRYQGAQSGTDDPDDFIQVWEIDEPEPRAFLTRRVAYSNDPFDDPLAQAANWAVQGIEAVVIEDPAGENRAFAFPEELESDGPLYLPGGGVTFERDDPECVQLGVSAPEECYLILRDGWFPEWRAWIDGEEARIYPADAAFRAVRVPAGEHQIEFRYIPWSFRLGMWVTIGTLIVLLLLTILPVFRGDYRGAFRRKTYKTPL